MKRSALMPLASALLCCMCFAGQVNAQASGAQENRGVGAVLGLSAPPREPFPEIAAIDDQLNELAARPDAHVATELVEDARRALQRARVLSGQGNTGAAERAQQIAWAAFAAASHTIALHHAQIERAVVDRRRALAQAAAAAARQALEHARVQTASIEAPTP